jgi:hypothetical protein
MAPTDARIAADTPQERWVSPWGRAPSTLASKTWLIHTCPPAATRLGVRRPSPPGWSPRPCCRSRDEGPHRSHRPAIWLEEGPLVRPRPHRVCRGFCGRRPRWGSRSDTHTLKGADVSDTTRARPLRGPSVPRSEPRDRAARPGSDQKTGAADCDLTDLLQQAAITL